MSGAKRLAQAESKGLEVPTNEDLEKHGCADEKKESKEEAK